MIYEFDPQLNLKRIVVAGLGGTGSQIARSVARMLYDRKRRNMQVPDLVFIDPDRVEEKNVGRQMFTAADVGQDKAEVLARRFNFSLGLSVAARPEAFKAEWLGKLGSNLGVSSVLLIGAVDNHEARAEMAKFKGTWIDAGNHFDSGQVVIGNTSSLENIKNAVAEAKKMNRSKLMVSPNAALVFPELLTPEEKPQPQLSCADLMALGDQHLLINDAVAMVAAQYVYKLLYRQPVTTFKTFISIDTLAMRSVNLTEEELYAVA
jgi:PRTRC genetic system ThiF family protein